MTEPGSPVPVAVFASGGGTTLQALLDREPTSLWRVRLVVSNRASAGALERARKAGRETAVVPVSKRPEEDVARETLDVLRGQEIQLVLLAGYLRLVPGQVVRAFHRRMLNTHPALLPAFGGPGMYGEHVYKAVLAGGVRLTGVTVHWVTEEYDAGAPVAQWPVPVREGDTVATLQARVQQAERALYPYVVDAVAGALRDGREPGPVALHGDHFALRPVESDADLDRIIRTQPTQPTRHTP